MEHTITTVAFDYGGVLAKMIDDSFIHHMADCLNADFDQFRTSLWKYRSDYDQGILKARAYWKLVAEHAHVSWPTKTTSQDELVETLMLLDMVAYLSFNPGLLRWIRTLRAKGYRCIIISNMSAETYDMLLKGSFLEQYFDQMIISGWLNINKPDPRIFQAAMRKMQVEAGEILFLDDLAHNVEGAKKAGLHAVQFTTTQELEKFLSAQYPDLPRTGLVCDR